MEAHLHLRQQPPRSLELLPLSLRPRLDPRHAGTTQSVPDCCNSTRSRAVQERLYLLRRLCTCASSRLVAGYPTSVPATAWRARRQR
eukprot:460870-Rhodomonas_salina.2